MPLISVLNVTVLIVFAACCWKIHGCCCLDARRNAAAVSNGSSLQFDDVKSFGIFFVFVFFCFCLNYYCKYIYFLFCLYHCI